MSLLKGTVTALITPFSEDGSLIDEDSLARLIEFQVSKGVDAVVVCGSTGEAATLLDHEYQALVIRAKDIIGSRVPVFAGIGTNSTQKAVEIARFLEGELSASDGDGVMVVAPPYNKPTQEGIIRHIEEVRKSTKLPIMAYNVPGRTGVNILPPACETLAKKGIVSMIKEASGSVDQIMETIKLTEGYAHVLCGDDGLTLPTMVCGAKGVVSVASNVSPVLVKEVTNSALNGEWDRARKAHFQLLPLCKALFAESNPIPVKAAAKLMGLISHDTVRLPLLKASESTKERLSALLKDM